MGFKSEFQLKNFGLHHDCPDDFHDMRCLCLPTWLLWAMRIASSLYLISCVAYSVTVSPNNEYWMTFVTNWNLLINTLYMIIITIYSGIKLCRKPNNPEIQLRNISSSSNEFSPSVRSISIHEKVVWILFTVSYNTNVIILIIFWGVLKRNQSVTYLAICAHGINFILLAIDFNIHVMPVRFLHFVYNWVFIFVYILFTVIYNFASNKYVYPIFNFQQKPGIAVAYTIICLIVSVITQLVYCFLYRLKLWIKRPAAIINTFGSVDISYDG